MTELRDADLDVQPPDRRRALGGLPRQRRSGRVGAYCGRCEADLDAPDNPVGRDAVAVFAARHVGHDRRAAPTTDA